MQHVDIKKVLDIANGIAYRFSRNNDSYWRANCMYALNQDDLVGIAMVKVSEMLTRYDVATINYSFIKTTIGNAMKDARRRTMCGPRGGQVGHVYVSGLASDDSTSDPLEWVLVTDMDPNIVEYEEDQEVEDFFGEVAECLGDDHVDLLDHLIELDGKVAATARHLDLGYNKALRMRGEIQELWVHGPYEEEETNDSEIQL